jgi:hypothetical protein
MKLQNLKRTSAFFIGKKVLLASLNFMVIRFTSIIYKNQLFETVCFCSLTSFDSDFTDVVHGRGGKSN